MEGNKTLKGLLQTELARSVIGKRLTATDEDGQPLSSFVVKEIGFDGYGEVVFCDGGEETEFFDLSDAMELADLGFLKCEQVNLFSRLVTTFTLKEEATV